MALFGRAFWHTEMHAAYDLSSSNFKASSLSAWLCVALVLSLFHSESWMLFGLGLKLMSRESRLAVLRLQQVGSGKSVFGVRRKAALWGLPARGVWLNTV